MGSAVYVVKRVEEGWGIEHDGQRKGMAYLSKESAFEAIVLAASNAIREGHEVSIKVPGTALGEATLGVPTS